VQDERQRQELMQKGLKDLQSMKVCKYSTIIYPLRIRTRKGRGCFAVVELLRCCLERVDDD